MPALHLVYTVPYPQRMFYRGAYKIGRWLGAAPLYRKNYRWVDWPLPVHAPHSITLNLIKALKEDWKIYLYDGLESTDSLIDPGPEDVLLIHPTPSFTDWTVNKTWKGTDDTKAGHRLMKKFAADKTFLILPYTHDAHESPWLTETFSSGIRNVIFICGAIWTDTWAQSPYRSFDLNICRVDMCLNHEHYPLVKTQFNPKGKRKFLYIGTTMPYKNIPELERIAASVPGFAGGYISKGNVKGWTKIADYADLNPKIMSALAGEYDFFINCSSADAQATTVLEQMSFGMGVGCTPESGYAYDSLFQLSVGDTAHNVKQIAAMQNEDEDLLKSRALINRQYVQMNHDWSTFGIRVKEFLAKTLHNDGR